MLQLQERLDDAMRLKAEKWSHGLGGPVTGITKQGVHLTPSKLRLIQKSYASLNTIYVVTYLILDPP